MVFDRLFREATTDLQIKEEELKAYKRLVAKKDEEIALYKQKLYEISGGTLALHDEHGRESYDL